jgi:hypothetical protein
MSCKLHVLTVLLLLLLLLLLQTNCDTGEQLSEVNTQRIAWVVDRLQLSQQQQQHNIAKGAVLAHRLLTPLLNELREL